MRTPDGNLPLDADGDLPESRKNDALLDQIRELAAFERLAEDVPEPLSPDDTLAADPRRRDRILPEDVTADAGQADDAAPGVQLRELDHLSQVDRQSVTDTVGAFVESAKRRLVSLAADHLIPGIGGRAVDLYYQVRDVMDSVQALTSDNPVLEVPLPCPVPGLSFSVEIPLDGGEAAPPVAVCVSPDGPSLTGGWALDSPEQDNEQEHGSEAEPAPDPSAISRDARPPRSRSGPPVGCIVQIDLESLGLLKRRRLRAWELCVLATEYAALFRENPVLQRFEVVVITDPGRRCGLWVWIG
jgi:hypothetical protein